MATDELTAEQIDNTIKAVLEEGELSQRTHGIGRGFGQHVASVITALRADRDRLREEIAAKDAEIQRLKDENELCEFCEAPENPNGDNATGGDSLKVCHGCIHRRHAWAVSLGQKLAAPADEGKTCAPMEDWRGANEDWRKR